MNTTVLVALITGVATTVPPIIINIINNYNQLKVKNVEYNRTVRQKIVDEFIEKATNCMGIIDNQKIAEYYDGLYSLLIYFPSINKDNIDRLSDKIDYKLGNHADSKSDNSLIRHCLDIVIKELSKELSEK